MRHYHRVLDSVPRDRDLGSQRKVDNADPVAREPSHHVSVIGHRRQRLAGLSI
jgi:hypothetical protein